MCAASIRTPADAVQGLPVGCSVALELLVEKPFLLRCRLEGLPHSHALLASSGPLTQPSLPTQQACPALGSAPQPAAGWTLPVVPAAAHSGSGACLLTLRQAMASSLSGRER